MFCPYACRAARSERITGSNYKSDQTFDDSMLDVSHVRYKFNPACAWAFALRCRVLHRGSIGPLKLARAHVLTQARYTIEYRYIYQNCARKISYAKICKAKCFHDGATVSIILPNVPLELRMIFNPISHVLSVL